MIECNLTLSNAFLIIIDKSIKSFSLDKFAILQWFEHRESYQKIEKNRLKKTLNEYKRRITTIRRIRLIESIIEFLYNSLML